MNRGNKASTGNNVTIQVDGDFIGEQSWVEDKILKHLNNAYDRGVEFNFA
jgi:hypothetical protein